MENFVAIVGLEFDFPVNLSHFSPIRKSDPNLVNIQSSQSKSTKLFSEAGFVRLFDGKAVLLSPMVRALRKLENIIHEEMEKVSAQQILLPTLIKESLLETTERNNMEELFKLTDRSKRKYILGPTHEEAVTCLLGSESTLLQKNLPSRLYQISSKFRDELHPKHGLIRAREFIMKDLYCFDTHPDVRQKTYEEVKQQYHNFFQKLQVPYECVAGCTGEIGGIGSHEFHFLSDIGENNLIICNNCGFNVNVDLTKNKEICEKCSSNDVKLVKGIEVGHIFNIGTKYSKLLNAKFFDNFGNSKFIEMSCYGIGLTRLLGAAAEILSTRKEIRWPLAIAPYSVCIIPSKTGSKEESVANNVLYDIYSKLNQYLKGDVVVDDKTKTTIGKRLHYCKKLGFPYIVVIGKDMLNPSPQVELHEVYSGKSQLINPLDVADVVLKLILAQ